MPDRSESASTTPPEPALETVVSEADQPEHETGTTTAGPPRETTPTASPVAPTSGRLARARSYWLPSLPGAWVALVFACLSMTPSLLPRPGLMQGAVAGITVAIGYGVGVFGAWLWREYAGRAERRDVRPWSWPIFLIGGGSLFVVFFLLGQQWQRQSRGLVGIGPESLGSILLMPVVMVVLFALLVSASRGLRWLFRRSSRWMSGWMGAGAARATAWLVVAVLAVTLVDGVLVDGIISVADRTFAVRDTGTSAEAHQPTTALRSGGPGSRAVWDTLGFQGRNFVGRGPTTEQISAFNGSPAIEPIRVYAGIASVPDQPDSVESRANLAVDELDRTGGFDRAYVLVAGTTGTGWVDPATVTSLEYETGGDVATVAIQYSYLPSWASVVVDQQRAAEAGRALFDAVYERWSERPEAARPKLLVFGESLGSFALDAAFSGEADLRNRTAGGIFAGPPSFNPLHREFTDRRDPGSPEIEPIFHDGRTVRFTSNPATGIPPVSAPWEGSRILYMQHPSDPITWVDPGLIWSRPDWLSEPRGDDVNDNMRWLPVVTFWQVTMDMLGAVDVPPGHGHRYTQEYVDGWAAVISPPGWTPAKSEQLRAIVLAADGG